jgi:hypothetical protein
MLIDILVYHVFFDLATVGGKFEPMKKGRSNERPFWQAVYALRMALSSAEIFGRLPYSSTPTR